jgi:hypothetical protein
MVGWAHLSFRCAFVVREACLLFGSSESRLFFTDLV